MKKTITVIALLAGAVSGYSQGEIYFYNYSTQSGSTLKQAVFNVEGGSYSVTYNGSTVTETLGSVSSAVNSHESPTGSTAYTSAQLGGTTGAPADAIMLIASGFNDSIGSLSPIGTVLPFYTTSAGLGFIKGTEIITPNASTFSGQYTVAIAAWTINSTGLLGAANTLATAMTDAATGDPGYAWGISNTANDTASSSSQAFATPMPTTIESFSLGLSVPEPSTIALGVIGASTLLFRRRK